MNKGERKVKINVPFCFCPNIVLWKRKENIQNYVDLIENYDLINWFFNTSHLTKRNNNDNCLFELYHKLFLKRDYNK